MYIVTITNKATHEEMILNAFNSKEKALSMCEQWGWMYNDGKKSYWMGYEEFSDDVFDFLEDATPGRFVCEEDAIDVIQAAYKMGHITLEQRNKLLKIA